MTFTVTYPIAIAWVVGVLCGFVIGCLTTRRYWITRFKNLSRYGSQ